MHSFSDSSARSDAHRIRECAVRMSVDGRTGRFLVVASRTMTRGGFLFLHSANRQGQPGLTSCLGLQKCR